MRFLAELKRRKVFRVAAVYAATAFAVLEAADLVLPRVGVPDWALNFLVVTVLAGFPIAVVLAWALELTPDGGVRRTETASAASGDGAPLLGGRALTITALMVAVGVGLSAGWLLKPATPVAAGTSGEGPGAADGGAEAAGSATETADAPDLTADARPSVAVLPFDNLSADPEQGYFADGLTEEILNALAGLPNLLVTARTSSFYYKDRDVPVDEIAERLGVDHVLEGSVRRSGDQMRVTAQLIRATDGFHLWSDTYDRPVDDAFRVQSDISTQVASALGILLDERQRARMESAGARDPQAYALFARGFELYQRAHGQGPQIPLLLEANTFFDRAFDLAPDLWVARYHSADAYSHTLLELAAGADPASLPAAALGRAREEHERRLGDASRTAPNAAARDFIEITRRLFSDDWTGVAELTRRALTHTESCGYDQWMHLAGPGFGMARAAHRFFLRGTLCNGMDESNWLHAATSALYLGEAERAIEIIDEALVVANVVSLALEQSRVESLIHLGTFDEALAAARRMPTGASGRARAEAWVAAARGDRAAFEELRTPDTPDDQGSVGASIVLAARGGDREWTDALAAAVDARPAGPVSLLMAVYFCLCGAPFDRAVTPNLAARLEEAGLDWPPTPSLDWPLKTW